MSRSPTSTDYMNLAKVLLAGLLFLGYYILIGLAFFVGIPPESGNIILQGIAMIGPVIGAVASNMFPKNEDRTEADQTNIARLTEKVPPATVPEEARVDEPESR